MILRYGLDPTNRPEQSLERLIEFCEKASFREVMFLIHPEERSIGHPTIEESGPWVEWIVQAKEQLGQRNVKVSLNPWSTTYGAPRGRLLKPGQDFDMMVGETGVASRIGACPLGRAWQDYLIEYFCFLQREIRPVAIWVEDDWRLHNHGPDLGYGGCYCRLHMERFSKMVGAKVDRQTLLIRVLAPGKPDPWREEWIRLCGQSLLEPACRLADSLREVDPDARLGLMSSPPDVHSIEGRDWHRLLDVLSMGKRHLSRPNMWPYEEDIAIKNGPTVTRHTIANFDDPTDIYPEMESSPRCGQYSKSHQYVAWEMYHALLIGSNGITVNHFDNMGMNTFYDRGFGHALSQHKARFDALCSLKLNDRNARGVKVLFHPEVARAMHAPRQDTLACLRNRSETWSRVFYNLGISHGFTRHVGDNPDEVIAVSDQTLRAFENHEIEKILSRPLLLDLTSAEILMERGFGSQIGIKKIKQVTLEESAHSFEEICDPDPELFEGIKARMCAQRNARVFGEIEYDNQAQILTRTLRADLEERFPGSALFHNSLGGRVFSTMYPFTGVAQFFPAYFSVVRHLFFRELLFRMRGQGVTVASGSPFHLHSLKTGDGFLMAASNVTYDRVDGVTFCVSSRELKGKALQRLETDGAWERINPKVLCRGDIAEVRVDQDMLPLDSCIVMASSAGRA